MSLQRNRGRETKRRKETMYTINGQNGAITIIVMENFKQKNRWKMVHT